MAQQGRYDRSDKVISTAIRQRDRKQSGQSLRAGVITLLCLIALGFLCIFVFGAGDPNDNSAPICNGETMSPGDMCDEYQNGALTGTDTYQDLVNEQHNGNAGLRIFGMVLIGFSLVIAYPVYRANNSSVPWGNPSSAHCPKCGKANLREKRTSFSTQRGRTRTTTTGIVTLCTPGCGFNAVRRPGT